MEKSLRLFIVCLWVLLFASSSVQAFGASDIGNLKIKGYHFSSQIIGVTSSGKAVRIFAKNPSKFRYLILKLKGKFQNDLKVLWGREFVLRYKKKNLDIIEECDGVTTMKKSGITNMFHVGNSGTDIAMKLKGNRAGLFALAFFVPNNITKITLEQVGTEITNECTLPQEKQYSIFLATNSLSSASLNKITKLLENGGYNVIASKHLAKSEKQFTIMYAPGVENVAREISQRFMTKYNIVAKLKPINVLSSSDIVIWIGSGVFHDT